VTITKEERERRRGFIGSSDAAVLFGLSKWANLTDLYLSKVGEYEEEEEPDDDSKAVGTWLEGALIDYAEKKLDTEISRGGRFVEAPFAANTDGYVPGNNGTIDLVVEAKTSSETWRWGPSGTDEIPDEYMIQVQHQMLCTGADAAVVVVLLTGFGAQFRLYTIEREEEIIVTDRVPPEDIPRIESVKRLKREPNKEVPVDGSIVKAYQDHHAEFLRMKKIDEQLQAQVLLELQDAEAGTFPGGRVEYFGTERKGYEVKPTVVRRLRILKEEE
jgi:putative phage-type endonuclease